MWTGLRADWTTGENCLGWSVIFGDKQGKTGNAGLAAGWLDGYGPDSCSKPLRIYCVQQ